MTTVATTAAPPHARGSALHEAWRYRELLRLVVVRNLKVRYQRSVLGFLWALLNPLATVLILVAVFGHIIRIGVPDYWAFLVSGYFAWLFVMHTLGTSAFVVTDHGYMVRGAGFPAELLVVGSAVSRLVEFAIELLLAIVLVSVFLHGGVPPSVIVLPLIVAIHFLFTVGLALPIAAAAVFFHDIQHALPVALMLVAYLSPVFYPAEMVPESVQRVYMLNPVATLLSLYHAVLYHGRWPDPMLLAGGAALATITFVIGYAIFRKHRGLFAEIV